MSDCRLDSCARRGGGCEVCRYVEKLIYVATRYGVAETYLTPQSFGGTARFCPKCGRRIRKG